MKEMTTTTEQTETNSIDSLTKRDLDVAIAKALGWTVEYLTTITVRDGKFAWWLSDPQGKKRSIGLTENEAWFGFGEPGFENDYEGVPHYSTDANEALRLTLKGTITIHSYHNDKDEISCWGTGPHGTLDHDERPWSSPLWSHVYITEEMGHVEAFCVALCRAYLLSRQAATP